MGECTWTKRICDEMYACGASIQVIYGCGFSSGLPDRLVFHRCFTGLLEFKGDDTKLKLNQAMKMREIAKRDPDAVFIIRKPNLIQVTNHGIICETVLEFDGTGSGLLQALDEQHGVLLHWFLN